MPIILEVQWMEQNWGKYSKGTVFQSLGIEINGYLRVQLLGTWGEDFVLAYIPATLLQPVQTQGKRYIRYGVIGQGKGNQKELKRFDEVSLLTEKMRQLGLR